MKTKAVLFKYLVLLVSLILFLNSQVLAQISLNTTGNPPDNSAAFDIDFPDKGLLIPRVALVQTTLPNPITNPATSLLVYNTATQNDVTPGYYYWDATTSRWIRIGTANHTHATLTPGNGLSGSAYDGSTAQTWTLNYGSVTGLANANSNGTSVQVARADHQHKRDVRVAYNGTDIGTRNRLNFIAGSNVTLNITDDGINDEIDITINSTGGSGSAWLTTGNSGLVFPGNFLGTTDNVALGFRVANQFAGKVDFSSSTGHLFLGYQAGMNTTGQRNTFIGYQAGRANTTGEYNTGVGYRALYSNTTGYYNAAFGQQTLQANVGGTHNTGLGMEALVYNTSGSYNTSVGTFSTYSNYTGSYNTAVGYYALYSNTANNNTAVGYEAGRYITSGTNNVALGYQAGVASGSGNVQNTIAIGSGVQCNASNQIRLGNTSITTVFIPGINGNTTSNSANVYIDPTTGQLMRSTASGGGSAWLLTGNAGTTPGTHFLGTTDQKDLILKINNKDAYVIKYNNIFEKEHLFLGYGASNSSSILEDFEMRTASQTGLMISQFNDYAWGNNSNDGPFLKLARAKGSPTSPSPVDPGLWLGGIMFTAPSSSGYWPEYHQASIASQKRGTSAGQRAADLRFYTVSENETGNFFNYERMRIGSAGGVGINLNTGALNNDPYAYLHVNGGIGIGPGASVSGAISLTHGVRKSIQIATETQYGGTYNDHSGYLIYSIMPGGWGTAELHFACSNDWGSYNTTTPALRITQTAGYINGNIIQTSDKRIKTDIKELNYGLKEILKLKPLYYTKHIADSIYNGYVRFSMLEGHSWQEPGFIAQDVYNIIPEVVYKPEDENTELWGMDYSKLVPVLIKAIQEQQTQIEQLKKEIEELKKNKN